jgi:phage major head subunit gpT-like protein
MIVNLDIRRAANTELFKAIDTMSAPQPWRQCCQVIPGSRGKNYFEWLGDLPAVKPWLDERRIEGLKKQLYNITTVSYENTVGIMIDDLKAYPGIITPRVQSMASAFAKHPNSLFFTLLAAGLSGLCFDGVAFFSASHPVDESSVVNSNLVSGAGVDTLAHLTTDWSKVKQAFSAMVNRDGSPVHDELGSLHVYHSPYYQDVFDQLFNAAANTAGIVNPYFKQAVTHSAPWLGTSSTSTDWYVLKLDMPVKPFIFVEAEPINTDPPKAGWDESQAFSKKMVSFGACGEYGVGYGFPQLAVAVNNS